MTPSGYDTFLAADRKDQRDAFTAAAAGLGAAATNVEKDFWVCWTLDALFNRMPSGGPRLLFKGGTSLSKGFGLISRFSEDIDVTIFRDDLVEDARPDQLNALGSRQRKAKIEEIRDNCRAYIAATMQPRLESRLHAVLDAAGIARGQTRVDFDLDDREAQTLLVWYPSVAPHDEGYVRRAVKIEAGAKSALDPHSARTIRPYVADAVATISLDVQGVATVAAERTFWDKVIILHGLRRWFERRSALRGGGQRTSRHFYDIHCLMQAGVSARALADAALGENCVAHARLFFNSADLDLDRARPGSFALSPSPAMKEALKDDYTAMAGMIFNTPPAFDDILASVASLEASLNT